jgi:three-Cys-motif partner protein
MSIRPKPGKGKSRSGRRGRSWGFWTQGKLDVLRQYLPGFNVASSKKSTERIYLDLFAGEPDNVDRMTGQPMKGSASIALETIPPFTRLRFFELASKAAPLEAHLRARFPDRDIKVIPGDCNVTIAEALRELESVRWAPTFAFIDPNGPDCHWSTLLALSRHKAGSKYKIELWLLFPVGLFTRNLPIKKTIEPAAAKAMTEMFGTGEWGEIYNDRRAGILSGSEAAEEYLNLMRWRLENVLGYRRAHALEVNNEQGARLYDMIFATDNEAGDRIMTHLYNQALVDFPAMRQEAIARHKAPPPLVTVEELDLFDLTQYGPPPRPELPVVSYRYEPPPSPYRAETDAPPF